MRRRIVISGKARSRTSAGLRPRSGTEARRLEVATESARQEERRCLGQALHDGTGQLLAGALLHIETLALQLSGEEARRALENLRGIVKETLDGVRGLSHDLRPPTLVRLGLGAALAELAARTSTSGFQVRFSCPQPFPVPSPKTSLALFRVAQAALANVLTHAGAHLCTLTLLERRGSLRLDIEDDGRGFSPAAASGGIGLSGMRERATDLGGKFIVDSAVGSGTRLRVEVPLLSG